MEALPLMRHWSGRALSLAGGEFFSLIYFEWVPEKWRAPFTFALRGWLASMMALFICFYMQMDEPYWSAAAVWIVVQSTPGMAVSKGYYRILGTLVGALVGLLLVAWFVQTPEVFVFALALWIGACTLVANLLRNFRSYGMVLAGFTAAIVSLGAYDKPDSAFDVAMARASCTIIGVACAALVTWAFVKCEAREQVMKKLRLVIAAAAKRGSFPATVSLEERLTVARPLVADLIALDTQIEFAAAEAASFRVHADGARSLVAHLFGLMAAKRSMEAHVQRVGLPAMPEVNDLYEETLKLLADAPGYIDNDRWNEWEHALEQLRLRVLKAHPESSGLEKETIVASRYILDRLDDVLRHITRAVHDWKCLQGHAVWTPSLKLDFHRDQRLACINGFRAMLAVLFSGAFWIATAWSSGSGMLIQVAAVCSLFSTMPYPSQMALSFLYGTFLTGAAAFVCVYFVLPNVTGFPLMALVLGMFLIPGGMMLLNPKTVAIGLSYCVFFLSMGRIMNQMDYDVSILLNNELANIMGVVFGGFAYLLLWPPDPAAARRYLVHRIRIGLQRVSQAHHVTDPHLWQTRMFDRIYRLVDPNNPWAVKTDEWFDGGLAALDLGNEVLRLRYLEEEGKMSPQVTVQVTAVLDSFRCLVRDPSAAREAVREALRKVHEIPAATDDVQRQAGYRARASLEEMEAFFTEHSRFLKPA